MHLYPGELQAVANLLDVVKGIEQRKRVSITGLWVPMNLSELKIMATLQGPHLMWYLFRTPFLLH